MRWKIGVYTLLATIGLSTVFYCTNSEQTSVKETDNVITGKPKNTILAELEVFSFQDAVKFSDLIAEVKIKDLKKEIMEPSPKTIFSADIKDIYKGENGLSEINILQQGNSDYSFNGNELFKQNEKYVLFLKKAVGAEYDGTNTYWILGEETTTYSVIESDYLQKMSLYDNYLTDIEDEEKTKSFKEKEKKDTQVVKKVALKQKVKALTGKGDASK